MPIRELFHLMLMVDDFDPAQQFFDDLFDPVMLFTKSWSDFDKRWASISLIGSDFSFELMEASKNEEDAGAPSRNLLVASANTHSWPGTSTGRDAAAGRDVATTTSALRPDDRMRSAR